MEKSTIASDITTILDNWEGDFQVDKKLKDTTSYFIEFQTYLEDENARKPSAFFITSNDEVYALGYNNQDNLLALSGDDFAKNVVVNKPRKIDGLSGKKVRKILVSERFGAAVTKNGQLIYWGMDMSEIQFDIRKKQYIRLPHEPRNTLKIFDFGCGAHSITMITTSGDIYLWGCINLYYNEFYNFTKIPLRKNVEVKSISCGWYHIAMLDQKGDVWTFGYGSVGQLGYVWTVSEYGYTTPTKVQLPGSCKKVECGAYSTLFLMENGDVYACGSNSQSDHLCVGKPGFVTKPLKVQFTEKITDIAATYAWSLAERWQSLFAAYSEEAAFYYRWGDDVNLKSPEALNPSPTMMSIFINYRTPPSLAESEVLSNAVTDKTGPGLRAPSLETSVEKSVLDKWAVFDKTEDFIKNRASSFSVFLQLKGFSGEQSAYIVTADDDVYGVGNNTNSLLAVTGEESKKEKLDAPVLSASLSRKGVRKILLNMSTGAALTRDGMLYIWDRPSEPSVFHKNVSDVVMGAAFSAYLLENSVVYIHGRIHVDYGWKDNVKIKTPTDDTIVAVSAGDWHVALLSINSNVYTCGHGQYGQLGREWYKENSPYELEKVKLPGKCTKVECGVSSTWFLMSNGDLYACGANGFADRLNVGHNKTVITPEKVILPESVVDIVVGKRSTNNGSRICSFAIKTMSGKFYKWGGSVGKPTLDEGMSSVVDAFEEIEIPQSLSLVRIKNEADNEVHAGGSANANPLQYNLFADPLFSDVTLKLADGVIPAHRVLLYSKSALFRRLLTADSSTRDELDLSKKNPKAVKGLLKYLYGLPISERANTMQDVLDFLDLAIADGDSELISMSKAIVWKNALNEIFLWYKSEHPNDPALERFTSYIGEATFP